MWRPVKKRILEALRRAMREASGAMIETGWACLEFTKTRGWEERDPPEDRLSGYDALLAWAVETGLVQEELAERLERTARGQPQEAGRVVERAIELRALLYRIFSAIGSGAEPAPADLSEMNRWLPEANRHLRLVRVGGAWDWGWEEGADALDRVLWPVIRSAAELLTAPEVERVKLCDAHDCGWLFIDASRNRSRRWCDMAECGNRAKVERYRRRRRAERSSGEAGES